MHKLSDSAGVWPVTVLAVRHVDNVDVREVRVRLPLHDVGAGAGQRGARLHRAQPAVANCDGDLKCDYRFWESRKNTITIIWNSDRNIIIIQVVEIVVWLSTTRL